VLYVVGADPALDYPDARAWAEARARLGLLVVHELFLTRTARDADVVLPVLTYAEHGGTVGNIEGRIQRQDAAVRGPGVARTDGQIFSALAERLGDVLAYASAEDVFAEIARLIPGWAEDALVRAPRGVPRASASGGVPAPADAGRLALVVGTRLFDRGTMALRCPGVRGQAGEPFVGLHPDDARRLGVVDAAACEVRSPRGALRLAARVLPTLHPGHAYVPRGYESAPVSALMDERGPVAVTVRPVGGAG
jgi:predicted molibdopterin-dependent oxidoreductase YjgC